MNSANRSRRTTALSGDSGRRRLDVRVSRFTRREQALIDLLPVDGQPISSKQLITRLYGKNPGDHPFHARQIVIAGMRGIMRKTALHDFGFQIHKSARAGPHAINFWRA